jgi:hypothetical protein
VKSKRSELDFTKLLIDSHVSLLIDGRFLFPYFFQGTVFELQG